MALTKTNAQVRTRAPRAKVRAAPTVSVDSGDSGIAGLISSLDSVADSRAILLICLLVFLAYANSLGGEFVFDRHRSSRHQPEPEIVDESNEGFHHSRLGLSR